MSDKSDSESLESKVVDVQHELNKSLQSIQKQQKTIITSTSIDVEKTLSTDIFKKSSRLELCTWLEGKNLGYLVDKHTVLYHTMQSINDGDRVVLHQLDEYIKTSNSQDSYLDRKMAIEFSRLESDESKNCELVKDLLRIPLKASKSIFLHPVIEAYIDLKWKKTRKFITAHFCIYLAFLLTYSWFLASIFYRPLHHPSDFTSYVLSSSDLFQYPPTPPPPHPTSNDSDQSIVFPRTYDSQAAKNSRTITLRIIPELFANNDPTIDDSNRTMQEPQDYVYKIHETFSRCSGDSSDDMRTCARELIMFTTVTLLFIGEILQFLSLGPYTSFSELRFYFNFDNFIQIIVIFLAAASLVVQNEEHLEKWISAFGIVFAYIEFVFLLGRCPPIPYLHSGRSSVMFYNITRRIFKILLNLFILVVGFAFGFFILQKDTSRDHFENPIKSIVKTLIMVLGEYEINDMLEGKFANDNRLTLYFTMILLALLAIVGSLVMINLVVAIIVSNIEELKTDGTIQHTINKAYHIISHGNFCQWSLPGRKVKDSMKKEFPSSRVEICLHNICFNCKGLKVSSHIQQRLIEILEARNAV